VTAQTWQGQAAPQAEEPDGPSRAEAAMITKRSRRLLADLLGRDRRRAIWTAVLIMVASLAALIGPWLVGLGIDDGIPPLSRDGNAGPLIVLTVAFAVTVAVQALATRSYIYAMGQLGERIVIDLRKRLFAHFQELSVAFHEDYTSGKVISRQTSDIDAITSLFEDGMDSLVSAVVTLVLVGVGMLLLNWQLGLIVLAGFIPLTWLTAWFRRESATTYRRSREAIAQVIVQFVETMTGIRAVQAFRRQPRNDEIFAELNDAYCEATLRSYRLVALYAPAITLVGNVITAGMLCYGGLLVIDGDVKVGVLVTFLLYLRRFFDPLQDLAQFYNSFQGAAAALEKLSGVLAEQPSVPSRSPASPSVTPAARSSRISTWRSRPARPPRWSAAPEPARPRWPGCWPGSTIPTPAGWRWTGWTCATWTIRRCAPRSSSSPRRTSCSAGRSRTTSGSAGQPPTRPRSRRPPGRSARTPSSPRCPVVMTPTWASAVAGCRLASASSSRSRGPSSPPRPC
jgi:ATP-binding cassette, subfamily B, bacterial